MKNIRPEDPRRLGMFNTATQGLQWDGEHIKESLEQLFRAVDDLATAEIKYYYRRRTTRAWISGVSRMAAWITGTIGLLLPLLAATTNPEFKEWAQYGYAFLAVAASSLGANSLFGGTAGHVRFLSTQLELEKLMTKARVAWCHYLATGVNSAGINSTSNTDAGFALIQNYAHDLHTLSITETGVWGETLMKELAVYQQDIKSNKA